MGKAARVALRKAGKTATRDMRSEASKIVREDKHIKAHYAAKAIKVPKVKVSGFPMEWAITIDAVPVSLLGYPTRQTAKGVVTTINRGGRRTLIRHAFIQTLKSGHRGVFLRTSEKRYPIEEQYGSKPQHVLRKPGRAARVQQRGARVLGERFGPLFDMELAKTREK